MATNKTHVKCRGRWEVLGGISSEDAYSPENHHISELARKSQIRACKVVGGSTFCACKETENGYPRTEKGRKWVPDDSGGM